MRDRYECGKTRFSEKWRMGFSASLMYWPLVNTVMYSMVAPRYMNLYADVAALFFASVMSYITYCDCSTANSLSVSDVVPTLTPWSTALAKTADCRSVLTEMMSTVVALNKMHLRNLMDGSMRVEAHMAAADTDEEGKQLPWLLSTQT